MRKALLAIVAMCICASFFTSCRKDYTCVCGSSSYTIHATKNVAQADCEFYGSGCYLQ